jgi:hypothetical protein
MQNAMTDRLSTLRSELAEGERMLTDLENRRVKLEATLLRISGAIQVLEELLESGDAAGAAGQADVSVIGAEVAAD